MGYAPKGEVQTVLVLTLTDHKEVIVYYILFNTHVISEVTVVPRVMTDLL